MAQIRVTPELMNKTANTVAGQAEEWNNRVRGIIAHVQEMSAMWDGEANDAFNQVFNNDVQYFNQLAALMNEYYVAINTAAQAYVAGEQEVRGIVTRR